MKTETRLHLYKTLVRPILEYPAIPICTASRSQIKKMQSVQSKALRSAAKERPIDRRSTNEELHHKFNVEALNVRLYNMASKTWTKLETTNPEIMEMTNALDGGIGRDHYWWPTVSGYLQQYVHGPLPLYK